MTRPLVEIIEGLIEEPTVEVLAVWLEDVQAKAGGLAEVLEKHTEGCGDLIALLDRVAAYEARL